MFGIRNDEQCATRSGKKCLLDTPARQCLHSDKLHVFCKTRGRNQNITVRETDIHTDMETVSLYICAVRSGPSLPA